LLLRHRPGLSGAQDPPEFIETSEGLFFFLPTLFDKAYHLVGDTFTTAVYAKNVGFQIFPPAFAAKSLLRPLSQRGERMDWEKLLLFGKAISKEKSQIRHRLTKVRGKNDSKGKKVIGESLFLNF
jgi:hypothetical protein